MGDYAAEQPTDASYVTGGAVRKEVTVAEANVWVRPLPQFKNVPPLPYSDTVEPSDYLGPTEESNWVLPSRVLVGAYPSSLDDDLNAEILTSILRLGITTFVCLQHEYEHHGVTEYMWRNGFKLRPYIYEAVQLLDEMEDWPCGEKPEGLEFVHFPIVDCATVSDSRVLRLCKDLVKRLTQGENLYVHCWGGHGRTGTVIAVMMGLMYNLNAADAMSFTQFTHDMRAAPMGVPSPQTDEQRAQVTRIIKSVQARRKRHAEAQARAAVLGSPRSGSPRGTPRTTPRPGSSARRTPNPRVHYGSNGRRISTPRTPASAVPASLPRAVGSAAAASKATPTSRGGSKTPAAPKPTAPSRPARRRPAPRRGRGVPSGFPIGSYGLSRHGMPSHSSPSPPPSLTPTPPPGILPPARVGSFKGPPPSTVAWSAGRRRRASTGRSPSPVDGLRGGKRHGSVPRRPRVKTRQAGRAVGSGAPVGSAGGAARPIRPPVGPSKNVAGTVDAKPAPPARAPSAPPPKTHTPAPVPTASPAPASSASQQPATVSMLLASRARQGKTPVSEPAKADGDTHSPDSSTDASVGSNPAPVKVSGSRMPTAAPVPHRPTSRAKGRHTRHLHGHIVHPTV